MKSWPIGKDSDAGREWGQEEKGTTEDEMAGWHHWLDGRGSGWTLGVGDGQGGLTCCNSGDRKELDMTELLNWTELNMKSMRRQVWNHTSNRTNLFIGVNIWDSYVHCSLSSPPLALRVPIWGPPTAVNICGRALPTQGFKLQEGRTQACFTVRPQA